MKKLMIISDDNSDDSSDDEEDNPEKWRDDCFDYDDFYSQCYCNNIDDYISDNDSDSEEEDDYAEIFKKIDRYANYSVSNFGNVRFTTSEAASF